MPRERAVHCNRKTATCVAHNRREDRMRPRIVSDDCIRPRDCQDLTQTLAGAHDCVRTTDPGRAEVVNDSAGRRELVPLPPAKTQAELRFHLRHLETQTCQRGEQRFHPAVEISRREMEYSHRATAR